MDTLPQEIVDRIAWFTNGRENHAQLLTVSRSFQVAVERLRWASYLSLPSKDMNTFLAMYHGRRSRYLRFIKVVVPFPDLQQKGDTRLRCRESKDEIRANNELITRQISGLFTALRTLETQDLPHNQPARIRLRIETPYQLEEMDEICQTYLECDHRKYPSWRLCLLNPKTLPEISCITSLVVDRQLNPWTDLSCRYERALDFGLVAHLICKLPNLRDVDCAYLGERFPLAYSYRAVQHFTRVWEGPWRDSRHAFGKAIEGGTLPTGMNYARFLFGPRNQIGYFTDQNGALPDLVKPMSYDPLSAGLRLLSQQLTEFDLRVCASSSLFWPLPQEEATSPFWPNLKRLQVEFSPTTPSGTWFFQGPRGEGRGATGYQITEEHYPPTKKNRADKRWDRIWDREGGRYEDMSSDLFRVSPIDDILEPFLEAFAKALSNMPSLEVANLYTYLGWKTDLEEQYPHLKSRRKYRWGIKYLAEGTPRVEWQVDGWRPSAALHQRFKDLARDGQALEEQWIDSDAPYA
ncbi:hypothetical protein FQN54_008860 [Arachnomyces sp. PD_36]|nr:hypothetical protein FQN54_008860 [Arachnomyces sp. PD_36]